MKKLLLVFMIVGIAHVSYAQISLSERSELIKKAQALHDNTCGNTSKIPADNFQFFNGVSFVKISCPDNDDVLYLCDKDKTTWEEVRIISEMKSRYNAEGLKIINNGPMVYTTIYNNSKNHSEFNSVMTCEVEILLTMSPLNNERWMVSFERSNNNGWITKDTREIIIDSAAAEIQKAEIDTGAAPYHIVPH